VIAEAQAVAGITADQVGYVEAHGTGTRLGDAIEIQALTRAFQQTSDTRQSCLIGAVKGNIGHLDAAAGVAGFIKAVLAVERATIPASLHCDPPNEHLELAQTPFKLCPATVSWPDDGRSRIAGVSAFGIGGSNVHVVLGQAPVPLRGSGPQVLALSARDESALAMAAADLARYLRVKSPNLARVSATLAGRRRYPYRLAVAARSAAEAAEALEARAYADIDWDTYPMPQGVQRIPVPARPLSRRRFWVDPPDGTLTELLTSTGEPDPSAADLDRLCGALALDYLRWHWRPAVICFQCRQDRSASCR
jgi:acyl transferase domain-containing protein